MWLAMENGRPRGGAARARAQRRRRRVALAALCALAAASPLDAAPAGGREGPAGARLDERPVPDRDELLGWLRARDRAIRRLELAYTWSAEPAAPGEEPALWYLGTLAYDRGRVVGTRYSFLTPDVVWDWTSWDGSRSRAVRGELDRAPAVDERRALLDLPVSALPARDVLIVSEHAQRGALDGLAGNASGLLFFLEPWSQRLGRTQDLCVLRWEEVDGRPALVVLFDASNAPGDASDGDFGWPHCVWFDADTLLPLRLQTYSDRGQYARQGQPLDPVEEAFVPEPLRGDREREWVPLRYLRTLESRELEGGVHVATVVECGVATAGSPFRPSRIELLSGHLALNGSDTPCFEPPVSYPLTVVDQVTEERYVLAGGRDERFSLADLAFAGMLRAYGDRLGLEGAPQLERVAEGEPGCAYGAALFVDRALGGRARPAEVARALPPGSREGCGDPSPSTLASALRALGLHAATVRPSLERLRRHDGWFVVHLRQAGDDALHLAVAWAEPTAGGFRLLVPGVQVRDLAAPDLAAAWTGDVTIAARSAPELDRAVRALDPR